MDNSGLPVVFKVLKMFKYSNHVVELCRHLERCNIDTHKIHMGVSNILHLAFSQDILESFPYPLNVKERQKYIEKLNA
jgi:hypothetical protein